MAVPRHRARRGPETAPRVCGGGLSRDESCDRRDPISRDDGPRARFLETLGQACGETDWRVHAWCLMLNDSAPGDDDITLDRGSVKDGDLEPRGEPALPSEELGLCQYSGLTRL